MSKLTLGDLDLALDNLFTTRKVALESSVAGKLFKPMLAKRHTAILALPEFVRGKAPLAEELGTTDTLHDEFGGAIFTYLDAIEQAPDTSESVRLSAKRIRAAFVPHRSIFGDSYAEEAATAKKNRGKLAELETDLKSFPVPSGKTLFDWVTAFLDAGDRLATLLDQRANASTTTAPGTVGKLRGETLKLLYQFRATLRAEIAENESLARDLEHQVFAYLDELEERRGPTKTNAKGAPAEKPAGT